jgi:thioredoxin:protein disulfide reductase
MNPLNETLAHNPLWAFVTVFGAGVLTSLTPCVYPMIPITVSIFGAKETRSKWTAFVLATFYVMGIAVMYAGLGVLAALGGWASSKLLASPWFVIPLSIFFTTMSTSMFGLWEIRLPLGLQNSLSGMGGKGFLGAFLMGLGGGILIAPCTGPVLAAVLTYVATTRNAAMGAGLLFVYALGIGVLFWVIATFAVVLPKSGAWMEAVKSIFGVALVVASLYYLQNAFVPLAQYTSSTWRFVASNSGLLALGLGIGGIHLTFHQGWWRSSRKILGIGLLSLSIFGLVNFVMTPKTKLPWIYEEQQALAMAKRHHQPMLVDFWATYCTPCKLQEKTILGHPAVQRELQQFVLFKVDVSKDTERDQQLREKYKAPAELPLLVIIDAEGQERARAGKVESVGEMLRLLRQAR